LGSLKKGGGGLRWHGGFDILSLKLWLRTTVNIVASFAPDFQRGAGGAAAQIFLAAARALTLAFLLRFAWRFRSLTGPRRAAGVLCLVWLASYAMVFTSWEPQTMVYRVSDLVPITTLFFLGADGAAEEFWRFAPAVFAVCLGVGNFLGDVYPRSIAENNVLLQRMGFIRRATPPDSWVASPEANGGGEELYLPFFAQRRPILLTVYRDRPMDLVARLDPILAGGQAVFVSSAVMADPFWSYFFGGYRPVAAARDADGFELYRLTGARARPRGARRSS
jgi:hypothetical protein